MTSFHIPEKYRVSARAIAPSDRLWGDAVFEGKFEYPVRPTYQMQIDWDEDSSPTFIKSASTILEVVCDASLSNTFRDGPRSCPFHALALAVDVIEKLVHCGRLCHSVGSTVTT